MPRPLLMALWAALLLSCTAPVSPWRIPGTGQTTCFSDTDVIPCPGPGERFAGQDASHPGPARAYTDLGDGLVRDEVTGLTWTRELTAPLTWTEALDPPARGGFSDWRLPSVTELYSLMRFDGHFAEDAARSTPFIDTSAFEFAYGAEPGGRFIDVQLWTATPYVARTFDGDETVFGVNFADGRIKGYPRYEPGVSPPVPRRMRARYVRGPAYGGHDLVAGEDGVVEDLATGRWWQRRDDGVTRTWEQALAACAGLTLGGRDDWRLPDALELQSLVDYTRAPAVTGTAAIDPLFEQAPEASFWSSTTVLDGPADVAPRTAAYLSLGRALGLVSVPPGTPPRWLDVHGAGAQRADPKAGDPAVFSAGRGPQGDEVRIFHSVRCVRGGRDP